MKDSVGKIEVSKNRNDQDGWYLIFSSWLIVSAATLGSLFLDEIMGVEPCSLCWFQRVFMYPLVPILLAGMFPLDPRVTRYALPLALLGWTTALYHLLLQTGVIPADLQPCGPGPSCVSEEWGWNGLLSIPTLSFLSFTAVIGLQILFVRRRNQ